MSEQPPLNVLVSRETANIIRSVFLPANPRKMRKPHPDVMKAVQDFIAAVEQKSNPGGTGLEQSPSGCDDGRGDNGLTPGGAAGGRASGIPIPTIEPCAHLPKQAAWCKKCGAVKDDHDDPAEFVAAQPPEVLGRCFFCKEPLTPETHKAHRCGTGPTKIPGAT
jgi:hypothetical protein